MVAASGSRELLAAGLRLVEARFERQLRSDVPAVARLCEHVERYRGKMLRPRLVLVCGLAADPGLPGSADPRAVWRDEHITAAAFCEMIHVATLIHDDVLDEADIRRQGRTINGLHGNETAVILGDYLIAAAYHLCSQLRSPETSLLAAQVSMTMCTGELLQLSRRGQMDLDEPTYLEIIERKTGALVALACRLGATLADAPPAIVEALERYGRAVGTAFQIQDDLLDLTGRPDALGKPVGKDLETGKITLPVIHHLATVPQTERTHSLALMREASRNRPGGVVACHDNAPAHRLRERLEASGSLAYARQRAAELVAEAKAALRHVPNALARDLLADLAEAAVARSS